MGKCLGLCRKHHTPNTQAFEGKEPSAITLRHTKDKLSRSLQHRPVKDEARLGAMTQQDCGTTRAQFCGGWAEGSLSAGSSCAWHWCYLGPHRPSQSKVEKEMAPECSERRQFVDPSPSTAAGASPCLRSRTLSHAVPMSS